MAPYCWDNALTGISALNSQMFMWLGIKIRHKLLSQFYSNSTLCRSGGSKEVNGEPKKDGIATGANGCLCTPWWHFSEIPEIQEIWFLDLHPRRVLSLFVVANSAQLRWFVVPISIVTQNKMLRLPSRMGTFIYLLLLELGLLSIFSDHFIGFVSFNLEI